MGVVTNKDGSPKWFSYMKKDRKKQLNNALKHTAAAYNVPIETLQLGSDWGLHKGEYNDGSFNFIDMPEGVSAQTRFYGDWFGTGNDTKPTIELNEDYSINQKDFDHEFDHTADQYLAALNEDGTVRSGWGTGGNNTLTGYYYHDTYGGKETPYSKEYSDLNSYEERLPYFINRFLNNPNNRQRGALKKALSEATGGVLSDNLLHEDALSRVGQSSKSEYYSTDPREKWASALGTYRSMMAMPEHLRYTSKGYERSKVGSLSADEIQELFPDQGITSVHRYENIFNPRLDGNMRIRKETFEAIKRFMEENKINKTGDGFSMLKALSGRKET